MMWDALWALGPPFRFRRDSREMVVLRELVRASRQGWGGGSLSLIALYIVALSNTQSPPPPRMTQPVLHHISTREDSSGTKHLCKMLMFVDLEDAREFAQKHMSRIISAHHPHHVWVRVGRRGPLLDAGYKPRGTVYIEVIPWYAGSMPYSELCKWRTTMKHSVW